MSRISRVIPLASAAVLLLGTDAWAQLPPVTPAQVEAGRRVANVRLEPGDVELLRGDSAVVHAVLLDENGEPVDGALILFVSTSGGLSPQFSFVTDGMIRFTATTPGSQSGLLLVRVGDGEGGFQGITGVVEMGTLMVEVTERPATRIALEEPGYTAYAGTSFKLTGTVLTDDGSPHSTATVRWRSEDPGIATITASGVVTPSRPGSVTLVGSTENDVEVRYEMEVVANPVQQIQITPATAAVRTGDVVRFDVRPLDGNGRLIENIAISRSVADLDSAGGFFFEDNTFVAEVPGSFRVTATLGGRAATATVDVTPRAAPVRVELTGRGPVAHVATSDLWVFEGRDGRDYAYTGTHANGGGERMFAWDVTDPENIVLTDSVVVDARVVNDVKVNSDASWAIITREGNSTRGNGIVVLDLADPAHPTIMGELVDQLTAGIHNVWINGDVVYAVNDGTSAINIISMADPGHPTHAGRWELRPGESNKSLHDVWSDGRYLYVSYWDDGLVILDVGAGTHGGTPTAPAFVSQISYAQGNTHVAWRERDYVFLGDEIGTPDGMRGYIHVIDVADIENPVEVAKYEVPEAGAHNVWIEDGTLYIAYYQGGLRMVDVTGELRGDLYRQGRELGFIRTSGREGEAINPNSPMAWGPQPYKGYIFVSDMNSGLWVLKAQRPTVLTP